MAQCENQNGTPSQWRSRVFATGGQFDPYRGAMVVFGARLGDRGAISQKYLESPNFALRERNFQKFRSAGTSFSIILTKFQSFYSKLTTCQPIFEPFWRQ